MAFMGEMTNMYKILFEKSEKDKTTCDRHRYRWEDNIKMDPKEV